MTTSTHPAWHFLEERYVPVTTNPNYYPANVDEMCRNHTEAELSIHSHKLPDSDAFRERNDSSDALDAMESINEAEREGTISLAELRRELEADPTGEDIWPLGRDMCPDCRCAPNTPHSPDCDYLRYGPMSESTAQVTDSVINAAPEHVKRCVSEGFYGHPADVKVESCSECGAVTDIDYGPESALLPKRESGTEEETFSVPFRAQEFMFEELCEEGFEKIYDLIDDHHDLIIEMARDRFRKGYARYGSEMYSWSPERRLDETLQELADAVVYETSGPLE